MLCTEEMLVLLGPQWKRHRHSRLVSYFIVYRVEITQVTAALHAS